MMVDDGRRSSSTSDRLSSPEAPISDSREEDEAEDEDDEVRACLFDLRGHVSVLSELS